MSTLGDEIRAQQGVALRVGHELSDIAQNVRRQTASAEWVSTAGEQQRAVIGRYANDIDGAGRRAEALVTTIAHHAASVESHEAMLATVLGGHSNPHEAPHSPVERGSSMTGWL